MTTSERPDWEKLFAEAQAKFEVLSPEEKEETFCLQKEGYARAEASWPKAKFHWEGGVKVYDSYEDYCND